MAARDSFTCPVCEGEVAANAKACPECGACEKSGWSEDAVYDGLNLPDEAFDYDEFAAREFGSGPSRPADQRKWWWVAVIVLLAFTWLLLHGW